MSRIRAGRIVIGICVAIGMWLPRAAQAQDVAEGQRLFQEGLAAAEQGDLAGAVRAFEASYRANPAPEVLYNLAMCRQELGDYPGAANAFRQFAAALGDRISPEQAAEVEERLAALLPQIGRLAVEVGENGTSIVIDGADVGRSPIGPWFAVAPGRHQVVARKDGFVDASMSVDVLAGETANVALTLVAAAEGP